MDIERIKKNVEVTKLGCWSWLKSKTSDGYGQLTEKGVYWAAHRYSFTCVYGDIPKSLIIRHTCGNRSCCNPSHLLTGTHLDNYHDSKTVHLIGSATMRKKWDVNGIIFPTCREACRLTGLPIQTLIKFTKDGVFDVNAYREGCHRAGWIPKL